MTTNTRWLIEKIFKGTQNQLIDGVVSLCLDQPRVKSLFYVNSHTFYLFHKNPDLCAYALQSDFVYLDGKGPQWAFDLLGLTRAQKQTSADFLRPLLERLIKKNFRVFLLGYPQSDLLEIESFLRTAHPDLQLVGSHHGYFSNPAELFKALQSCRADLVFVGLGAPKQETFLWTHRQDLPPAVYFPVGAGFLIYCGKMKRAPRLMCLLGLEWFYRLLQEPQRLLKRYLVANSFLLYWTIKSFLQISIMKKNMKRRGA